MTSQLTFSSLVETRMRDANDIYTGGSQSNISLFHLVADFRSGHLLLPVHQREASWLPGKKKAYIGAICMDAAPPGSFEVYTVISDGKEGPRYLNDGVQRLLAANELSLSPERYGLTDSEADYVLRFTEYPMRLKKHRSHAEALDRFLRVNSNVPLTPYQLTRGILLYSMGDHYTDIWQAWLDELNAIVSKALIRVTKRTSEYNSTQEKYLELTHKAYRQTSSMFLRYLSGDRTGREYQVATSKIKDTETLFEIELADLLKGLGPSGANARLLQFTNLIDSECALIEDAWQQTSHKKESIRNACVRWLLDLAIYRRNCNVPTTPWADFISKLLTYNGGSTEVLFIRDGKQGRQSISFGRVKNIDSIASIVGSDIMKFFETSRKRPSARLPSGVHHSHVLPFSLYGNGETIAEPALLNLSRGAKPIESFTTGV